MDKLIRGTHAAVLTPRKPDSSIDSLTLRSLLKFLLNAGMNGFAIGGATGEFCSLSEEELRELLDVTSEIATGDTGFLVGIGAADISGTIRRGEIARKAGAKGVLLPMPYFFPYAQEDLAAFVREVAATVDLPILLYNLPQFTSGLEPATTLELIQGCSSIEGVKDSSGSLQTLRLLSQEAPEACRIIGNDGALPQALTEGIADAIISGVACVFPELLASIFEEGASASPKWDATVTALRDVLTQLNKVPTPWGLKMLAEVRGIAKATFPLPLSEGRIRVRDEMAEWYRQNDEDLLVAAPISSQSDQKESL
jgi:4-hydroxy-tetrahydrodipicolinate synthase